MAGLLPNERSTKIVLDGRISKFILENRGVGFDLTPRGKLN